MNRLRRGSSAGPADVNTPGNGVEFKVVDLDLASLGVDGEIVDTLDWVDASTKRRNIPAP